MRGTTGTRIGNGQDRLEKEEASDLITYHELTVPDMKVALISALERWAMATLVRTSGAWIARRRW
jgi:hypothetical protein